MKKFQITTVRMVVLLSLLISFSSSIVKKQFILARYTQSNMGATCLPATTLPGVCTSINTGLICETAFGSATRTWYKDACINPYYKLP